jgi:acylphosphatase
MAMSDAATQERRTVHFRGRVQGVGFRYTTRQIAGGFRVTGYVQNLPDGSVRLVAEGAVSELDRFVAEIREQMSGFIRQLQADSQPATNEFDDFGIRH